MEPLQKTEAMPLSPILSAPNTASDKYVAPSAPRIRARNRHKKRLDGKNASHQWSAIQPQTAGEIMSSPVVTIHPDTFVSEVAAKFLRHGISGAPVLGANGTIVGIVTEADLLHRPELGSGKIRRPIWRSVLQTPSELAENYIRTHGMRASDIMTTPVKTIDDSTAVDTIVHLMEKYRIKRLPVVRENRIVGIVSRSDLLKRLAAQRSAVFENIEDDNKLWQRLTASLQDEAWADLFHAYITVNDGTAYLRGYVESDAQIRAFAIAAERTPGIKAVVNQLTKTPPYLFWDG